MNQFSDLGLSEALLRALSAEGHTTPTQIQTDVIPGLLSGRDVLGIAETGTGKTASFVLPVLHILSQEKVRPQPKTCRALIVTPTRELAAQIAQVIRIYSKHTRLSVALVVGGERPGPQVRALAQGRDIVVATPGRLLDHMNTGAVRLDDAYMVVLDEADQMLDMGFVPAIRKLMAKLPNDRVTAMMSATMPPKIRALAGEFLDRPLEFRIAPQARPQAAIAQTVELMPTGGKRERVTEILSGPDVSSAIVFTRTKRGADKLCRFLTEDGLNATAIHGNKTQGQRNRALAHFKNGQAKILVATDVAARGIHIDDVSHVVNYDMPAVAEAYVHRIGRTGRAGRSGVAISLCDETERGLLRDIEKLIGRRLDGSGNSGDFDNDEGGRKRSSASRHPSKNKNRKPGRGKPRYNKSGKSKTGGSASGRARMLDNAGKRTDKSAA